MVNKIFLDTNIVVDLLLERKYELDAIEEIFRLAEKEKIDLYISESVITTTFYISQKHKIDTLSFFREICKTVNVIPFQKIFYFIRLKNIKILKMVSYIFWLQKLK